MRVRSAVLTLLAVGALGGLTGCGQASTKTTADAPPSPVATVAAATTPDCGQVWKAGQKLSESYSGCMRDGQVVKAHKQSCSSGQTLVTFDNAYYAVTGGPVQHVPGLAQTERYKKMMRACNG